jgi:Ser/Thr protein kinase RdoA (MazF antagonist)
METRHSTDELLKNWQVGHVGLVEAISSYSGNVSLVTTAEHGCFILKKRPDPAAAEREIKILCRLSEVGAPVAVPVRTVDEAWYASSGGQIFCLYPQLPGEIVEEHYAGHATARARMFGQAIGFLHSCLLKCGNLSGYRDMRLMEQIREWAIPCIREHTTAVDGDSIEQIWTEVEQELGPVYDELPTQLIHRDLHPANMLFDSGGLAGFVDFEMVVRGPRIFDVCYCGTSLLASGFLDTEKMRCWPALFRSLLKGYQEVCPLIPSELMALRGTLAAIELLFAAFSFETRSEGAARCNISVLRWLSANSELI